MKHRRGVAVLVALLMGVSTVPAGAERPSAEIVRAPDGKHFYLFARPGTGYEDAKKRYIGTPSVLDYYLSRLDIDHVPTLPQRELDDRPTHSWDLGIPCGEIVHERATGKLFVMEPAGPSDDQASGGFAYSNVFPIHIPDTRSPFIRRVLNRAEVVSLDRVPNQIGASYDPWGFPTCTIVKQSGTDDFYRLTGYTQQDGRREQRKSYIGHIEMLLLWLHFNSFFVEGDVARLPDAPVAPIPPGLLVRDLDDPTVYFTDDEGFKVRIPSNESFHELGFSDEDVRIVSRAALETTPTAERDLSVDRPPSGGGSGLPTTG